MPKKSNMYQYGLTCPTQPNMEGQDWKKKSINKMGKKNDWRKLKQTS
jgi:hypothetical protein